jgi:hypothetical protein
MMLPGEHYGARLGCGEGQLLVGAWRVGVLTMTQARKEIRLLLTENWVMAH